MNRRELLRLGMTGVVAVPLMGAAGVVALGKRKPEQLEPFFAGRVLSVEAMNALVARVNELSERDL